MCSNGWRPVDAGQTRAAQHSTVVQTRKTLKAKGGGSGKASRAVRIALRGPDCSLAACRTRVDGWRDKIFEAGRDDGLMRAQCVGQEKERAEGQGTEGGGVEWKFSMRLGKALREQRSCLIREEAPRGRYWSLAGGSHKLRLAGKRRPANCENAEDGLLPNGGCWSTGRILGAHASGSSHDKPWLLKISRSEESRTRVSQVGYQVRTTQTVRSDCLMLQSPAASSALACLAGSFLCAALRCAALLCGPARYSACARLNLSLSVCVCVCAQSRAWRQRARRREQVCFWCGPRRVGRRISGREGPACGRAAIGPSLMYRATFLAPAPAVAEHGVRAFRWTSGDSRRTRSATPIITLTTRRPRPPLPTTVLLFVVRVGSRKVPGARFDFGRGRGKGG